MKVISVTLKYKDNNGNDANEVFYSLLQCATKYNISVPTLKNVIAGKATRMKKIFPKDCVFETNEIIKEKQENWHCDICNIDIKCTSKTLHQMSAKHKIHASYQNMNS